MDPVAHNFRLPQLWEDRIEHSLHASFLSLCLPVLRCAVLWHEQTGDQNLHGVTHVIVDEIHERGMNEDFLLIVLRRLIASGARPDLRIILMSATINAGLFSAYFNDCPTLHIPVHYGLA